MRVHIILYQDYSLWILYGFDKIHTLGVGESPLDYINRIDDEYFEKMSK